MRRAQEHVAYFEETYKITLDELMVQGLPDDADYQAHEDFIEWEYWQDVSNETEMIIRNVKQIVRKAEMVSDLH